MNPTKNKTQSDKQPVYQRTFVSVGFPSLARRQLARAMHALSETGAAELYFSRPDGIERLRESGQIAINVTITYGRSFTEERIHGAMEGY